MEEKGKNKIDKLIRENKTIYDMFGDKSEKKYGDEKRKKLQKFEVDKLPIYIRNNLKNFEEWID